MTLKKIILILALLCVSLNAKTAKPKMGCILAQQGKVTFEWAMYGDEKYAIQGKDNNVKYTAIKKEGHIFKEILVGSTVKTKLQGEELEAKIVHIQSKKRIGRGPRHGVIVFNITLNNISKDIPMVYFYEGGDMIATANIDMNHFKLSSKTKYCELKFGLHVYSVVCAIEH